MTIYLARVTNHIEGSLANGDLDEFWKLADNCESSIEPAESADALRTNLSQTLKEDTQ